MYLFVMDTTTLLVPGWPHAARKRSQLDRDGVSLAESAIFSLYSATYMYMYMYSTCNWAWLGLRATMRSILLVIIGYSTTVYTVHDCTCTCFETSSFVLLYTCTLHTD